MIVKIKAEEVKLRVAFTEGYRQRFTKACLKELELRKKRRKTKEVAPESVA